MLYEVITDDFDALGNLEPVAAGNHCKRQVGRAHAGGEGTERTVRTGVRVRADNDVTRNHKPLFRKQGVLNSHVFLVKKVLHTVFFCKITADTGLIGRCA